MAFFPAVQARTATTKSALIGVLKVVQAQLVNPIEGTNGRDASFLSKRDVESGKYLANLSSDDGPQYFFVPKSLLPNIMHDESISDNLFKPSESTTEHATALAPKISGSYEVSHGKDFRDIVPNSLCSFWGEAPSLTLVQALSLKREGVDDVKSDCTLPPSDLPLLNAQGTTVGVPSSAHVSPSTAALFRAVAQADLKAVRRLLRSAHSLPEETGDNPSKINSRGSNDSGGTSGNSDSGIVATSVGKEECDSGGGGMGGGVSVDAIHPSHGGSPLHVAAGLRGDVEVQLEVIGELVRAGGSIGARAANGSTPLHWAAGAGREQAALKLLEMGADAQARTYTWGRQVFGKASGQTPAHWAAESGHTACVRVCSDHMAEVSMAEDERGETPRSLARKELRFETLDLLDKLEQEAFVCVRFEVGPTVARPLHPHQHPPRQDVDGVDTLLGSSTR